MPGRDTVASVAQEVEYLAKHIAEMKREIKELEQSIVRLRLQHELLSNKSDLTDGRMDGFMSHISWGVKVFIGVIITGLAGFMLRGGLL